MTSLFPFLSSRAGRRALAASLILLSSAGSALAGETKSYPKCDREPSESDVTAAKGAFEAGQVSFQEADYERAVLYWEDAFRRDCTAAPLLLNLSRAYELWGKKSLAVGALETFLERRPTYEDRPAIEKRIAALRKQVSEEEARLAAAQAKEARPPSDEPIAAEPDEVPSGRPVWPVITTGVGITAAAVGLGVALAAQSTIDVCPPLPDGQRNCPNLAAQNAAEDAQAPRNVGIAIAAVGGAALVTGGIFWVLLWNQPASSDDETARVARRFSPLLSPTFAGLSYGSTF